jgi:hypothetical protein
MPIISVTSFLVASPGSDGFWDVVAKVLSQYPDLDEQGIMNYGLIARNFSGAFGITEPVDAYFAPMLMPVLHPENTSDSVTAAINKVFDEATAGSPVQFQKAVIPQTYPDFWAWYNVSNGPLDAGTDQYLGSRLLDKTALTQNLTALAAAYKAATPMGSIASVFLVGGKGVINAKPRGGSNAVNSAWRKAYVHSGTYTGHKREVWLTEAVITVQWDPFDEAEKTKQTDLLNNVYIEALREFTPGMGAYVNEVRFSLDRTRLELLTFFEGL